MDKDRIEGAAKDTAGKVESTVGNIAGDEDTQAAGRIREAAGKVQNLYGQTKDAARDTAGAATEYAQKAIHNAGDGAATMAKIVQENPVGSLLVAGGIGFVLALLLRQPLRRPQRRWRYYD